jgi:hypothetical protein
VLFYLGQRISQRVELFPVAFFSHQIYLDRASHFHLPLRIIQDIGIIPEPRGFFEGAFGIFRQDVWGYIRPTRTFLLDLQGLNSVFTPCVWYVFPVVANMSMGARCRLPRMDAGWNGRFDRMK